MHGKPGHVSVKLDFNSDSESDPSDVDYTQNLSKNRNFDNGMTSFDKKTIQFIQKLHVHKNLFKFVLSCIPGFDAKIAAMKTNVDKNPPNTKLDVSTSVSFKTLLTKHQDKLPLRHMAKKDL